MAASFCVALLGAIAGQSAIPPGEQTKYKRAWSLAEWTSFRQCLIAQEARIIGRDVQLGVTVDDCVCKTSGTCVEAGKEAANEGQSWFSDLDKRVTRDAFIIRLLIFGIVCATSISIFYLLISFIWPLSVGSVRLASWCIEATPMLGIAGTLYGIMLYFAGVGEAPDYDQFLSHFAVSASMTILGAFANVVNQFVWTVSLGRKATAATKGVKGAQSTLGSE